MNHYMNYMERIEKMIEISENSTPYEVANELIYASRKAKNIYGHEIEVDAFNLKELKKIGEYLISYAEIESEEDE